MCFATAVFGILYKCLIARVGSQRCEPWIARNRGRAEKPAIDCSKESRDGAFGLIDPGKLAPSIKQYLRISQQSSLSAHDCVQAFFRVAFEVCAQRRHDSLEGPRGAPGSLPFSQHRERGLIISRGGERSAIEVMR